jgi:hypothetical protein
LYLVVVVLVAAAAEGVLGFKLSCNTSYPDSFRSFYQSL